MTALSIEEKSMLPPDKLDKLSFYMTKHTISIQCSYRIIKVHNKMCLGLLAPIGFITHLDHQPFGNPEAEGVLETDGIVF